MARAVTIRVKKQIQLDRLDFKQQSMVKLGTVGNASVIDRVGKVLNSEDQSSKPLTKQYAIRKTKAGKGNRRNLRFTGNMLRELSVRTVTQNRSNSGLTTDRNRRKARGNQAIEPWLLFSPNNQQAVSGAAQQILKEMLPRIVIQRVLAS